VRNILKMQRRQTTSLTYSEGEIAYRAPSRLELERREKGGKGLEEG
jgi:hypothetical protein